jgi:hypothetical protein
MKGLVFLAVAAIGLAGCATPTERLERIGADCSASEVIATPNFYQRMTSAEIDRKYGCVRQGIQADRRLRNLENADIYASALNMEEMFRREVAAGRLSPADATMRWSAYEAQYRDILAQRAMAGAAAASAAAQNNQALMGYGLGLMQQGAPRTYGPSGMVSCTQQGAFTNCRY